MSTRPGCTPIPRAQRAVSFALVIIMMGALAGCGRSPEQLRQQAVQAEADARAAQARSDVQAAQRAAEAARKAADRLKKLATADKSGREDLHRLLGEAETAARSAQELAQLAGEEQERRELLGSLKVKAYKTARAVMFTTLLPQMAAAAERAGQGGAGGLSALERPVADRALKLAGLIGTRLPLPDGTPDWKGAARDLRLWSTNSSIELHAFLALALFTLGNSDLALIEFESAETNQISGPNALLIHHGGRALLYAMRGWNRLAAPEIEAFSRLAALSDGPVDGKKILAAFHFLLACNAQRQGNGAQMDAEIAQVIRVWPNNPLAVYLTGEQLAANGEWEKAAASLETWSAGREEEWVVARFAQRARDLRDGKGSAKALVMDPRFLAEVVAHFAGQAARESAAGRKLKDWVSEARQFGEELRDKLPLLRGKAAPAGDL